ncbi:hypothetical protein BSA16_13990, partial [Micromonospora sp. Rc5]|uniref:WXG100-like domain-containing protein n=2 Tax=unclassified Micromonospora TaxID=2617518 RepID=UPI0009CB76EA
MAIEVSAELANFLRFLIGEKFPRADETNLFATAEELRRAAEQVAASSETFGDGVRAYRAGVNGQAEDSFVDTMERYVLHSPGYLGLVSKYTNRMGDSYRGTATEVQYAKLMIIASLLALMVELLTALAIAWINPGAALARLAVGRVIMRVIFQNVTTRVLFQVAMAQAVGIGLQTVMDRLVQLYQIRNHTRDGWNDELTRAAAEVGSLGGAVGLGLGGLMQGLERLARSTNVGRRVGLSASSNTPDPHGFRPGEAAQEVLNEGVSEWLTEFLYNGITTGEWDADGAAVVAGAMSGLASVAGTAIGQQLNKATGGDRDRTSKSSALAEQEPPASADPTVDEPLPAYDPVRLPAYDGPPSYAEAVAAVPGVGAAPTGAGGTTPGGAGRGGAAGTGAGGTGPAARTGAGGGSAEADADAAGRLRRADGESTEPGEPAGPERVDPSGLTAGGSTDLSDLLTTHDLSTTSDLSATSDLSSTPGVPASADAPSASGLPASSGTAAGQPGGAAGGAPSGARTGGSAPVPGAAPEAGAGGPAGGGRASGADPAAPGRPTVGSWTGGPQPVGAPPAGGSGPGTPPVGPQPVSVGAVTAALGTPVEGRGATLEQRLTGVLPPYDGTALDCVIRLAAVVGEFSPAPRPPRVTRDDAAIDPVRPESELAAQLGVEWQPVADWAQIVGRVSEAGPNALAAVLVEPPNAPRHAFALVNDGGELFWVETQAASGRRVRPVGNPPEPPVGARVIVLDGQGFPVPVTPGDTATVRALVDPATTSRYGMSRPDPTHPEPATTSPSVDPVPVPTVEQVTRTAEGLPPDLVRVPANGRCLPYAVLTSAPGVVSSRLADAGLLTPQVDRWLAEADDVRAAVSWHAEQLSIGATSVPDDAPLNRTADALIGLVAGYLTTHRDALPAVLPEIRQALADRERTDPGLVSRADRLALLERHGYTGLPELTDDELLTTYLDWYAFHAGPLTDQEFDVLLAAVHDWSRSWSEPVGLALLPLLAHALDVSLSVRSRADGRERAVYGPADAAAVTVYHNDRDHFDASSAEPSSPAAPDTPTTPA